MTPPATSAAGTSIPASQKAPGYLAPGLHRLQLQMRCAFGPGRHQVSRCRRCRRVRSRRRPCQQTRATVSSGTWNGAGELTAYSDPAPPMTAAAYNGDGLRASSTTGGTNQSYTWDVVASRPRFLTDSATAYI